MPKVLRLICAFLELAVETVEEVVGYALHASHVSQGRSSRQTSQRHNFLQFVTTVLCNARVTPPVLLVATAYIERAKPHLEIMQARWAKERVFMGALILANKVCVRTHCLFSTQVVIRVVPQ